MPEYLGQVIYIRPNYLVSMPEYDTQRNFHSASFRNNKENLKKNNHQGRLSDKSIKKLKNAVNWLAASAKAKTVFSKIDNKHYTFKINFITLTLPDTKKRISDFDLQKNLLSPFLSYMRKYYGFNNYVWKLEFQSNGKLHVHITSDTFIHYSKLRSIWNNLLIKHGYMAEFEKKYGHSDPNSTDVHAVYKIKNIAGYISKYVSKGMKMFYLNPNEKVQRFNGVNHKIWMEQKSNFFNSPLSPYRIKGRIWSCSYSLVKASKTKVFIDRNSCGDEMKSLMRKEIKYKSITNTNLVTGETKSVGELFMLDQKDWEKYVRGVVKECFTDAKINLRNPNAELPPDDDYIPIQFQNPISFIPIVEKKEKPIKQKILQAVLSF